jgi:putative redox protein
MLHDAVVRTAEGKFRQSIVIGEHVLVADEPRDVGGDDAGPTPHELFLAALGTCTSMTMKMYAERKGWPLERCEVTVSMSREGNATTLHRKIVLSGPLDDEQRRRILEIARKCPVHRTLSNPIAIEDS